MTKIQVITEDARGERWEINISPEPGDSEGVRGPTVEIRQAPFEPSKINPFLRAQRKANEAKAEEGRR